jgi:5-methylcytosine-specific restriction endonuclease McrA
MAKVIRKDNVSPMLIKMDAGRNRYKHLYDAPEWKALRRAIWRRDAGLCAMCGLVTYGRSPAPTSAVCDHIRPHRGDAVLFRDPANLQTLHKACHDRHKQGIEVRGYSMASDASGWPTDPAHPANRRA